MKIVFIGTSDELARALAERMGQEGHEVCLLSDGAHWQKPVSALRHRFYPSPRKGKSLGNLIGSISPDCVIFAGNHYIGGIHAEEADEDVTLLARSLRAACAFPHVKFILLSSTEVYGNTWEKADESAERAAVSERGFWFIREEGLLEIYRRQKGMDAVILRASQLYTDRPKEGEGDFLSRIFCVASQAEGGMPDSVFQPLHVSDFVDAVKRVMDGGKHPVYNVCGSAEVSAKNLYRLVCQQEKVPERDMAWENPGCATRADSSRIRQELGWGDLRDLEEQLRGGGIVYERAHARKRKAGKRNPSVPVKIRQLAENLLIFMVFWGWHFLCASNSLFARIDWMMI